jgi:hypothetical protein
MYTVQQILMEWAFKNEEYYMAYMLYTEFDTGIPNFLLYSLKKKTYFNSIENFLKTSECFAHVTDKYLQKIFVLFKKSNFIKLKNWDNSYGYILRK